ncbi:hypothetical protein JTE90_007074 [Oedothorax gibbosus]|uniref:Uncharacterized protein n=1 Tax=Oedothorax gibbosus TaxID=931172 RepID=A0AAV6TPG1_9ARAC|nr:hypothetical protein JTE90_007074 [Oedothorax gibbosus]
MGKAPPGGAPLAKSTTVPGLADFIHGPHSRVPISKFATKPSLWVKFSPRDDTGGTSSHGKPNNVFFYISRPSPRGAPPNPKKTVYEIFTNGRPPPWAPPPTVLRKVWMPRLEDREEIGLRIRIRFPGKIPDGENWGMVKGFGFPRKGEVALLKKIKISPPFDVNKREFLGKDPPK